MSAIVVVPPQQPKVHLTARHHQLSTVTAPTQPVEVTIPTGKTGPQGPPGDDAQWDAMTQAEYDALPVKDPNTLYVIVP